MENMYIQPKVETTVLTVGSLMAPASPTDGKMDPTLAPTRDPKIF